MMVSKQLTSNAVHATNTILACSYSSNTTYYTRTTEKTNNKRRKTDTQINTNKEVRNDVTNEQGKQQYLTPNQLSKTGDYIHIHTYTYNHCSLQIQNNNASRSHTHTQTYIISTQSVYSFAHTLIYTHTYITTYIYIYTHKRTT